jgi:hypothetical protein
VGDHECTSITLADACAAEGQTTTLDVTKSHGVQVGEVTVTYLIIDGEATASHDYDTAVVEAAS